MRFRFIALCWFFATSCAPVACARDMFVMLSGGVSPFDNNYSQYLQARAVATYFEQNYPVDSIRIFFGAGNVEGKEPVFGDVCRTTRENGFTVESWTAGPLRHNLPATREVILRVLREEILPAIADGGTLFLFVGDHGSQTRDRKSESAIDLWEFERDPDADHGWRSRTDATLSVSELRRTLAAGIGKGRVVFCMTQCHPGGFHYLAVPREMTPNPAWFIRAPIWLRPQSRTNFLSVAGFTATDELSPAAGCVSDPDPDSWVGYERFVAENLLGLDLFTLKPTGKALPSFAQAHITATLADNTIDKPRTTSDEYLERWANLVETRLADEPNLTGNIKNLVAAYQNAVDGATHKISNPAFLERQSLFRRFTEKMCEQNPSAKNLLLNGRRMELEAAIGFDNRPDESREFIPRNRLQTNSVPRERPRGGRFGESRRLWNETVRPAWKLALEANQVTNVPPRALEFEKYLLSLEDRGSNYFSGGANGLREQVFWQSGYSDPQTLQPAKAKAVARWGASRRREILGWTKTTDDPDVRAAGEKISQARRMRSPPPPAGQSNSSRPTLDKETAAERALFYRRVLAAWEFLLAANERPALARLRELIELERTPLPLPARK